MLTITRLFEWDAAHRLLGHEGQCRSLHGHRYKAEITFHSGGVDGLGRVIDFGEVKRIVKSWIDEHWDHTTIVQDRDTKLVEFLDDQHDQGRGKRAYVMGGAPTAELMAQILFEKSNQLMNPYDVRVLNVKLYETPNCWAEYGEAVTGP